MSTAPSPDQPPPAGPVVGLVMGSDSDWPVMEAAAEALAEFGIPFEADVVSAHRMPHEMIRYGQRPTSAVCASSSPAPAAPRIFPACSPRSLRCR